MSVRILALVGSLRAGSTNRQLAEAAVKLAPEGAEVEVFDGLADIPFYNEDIDVEGSVPAAAVKLHVGAAPVQAPDQPAKREPASGAAESVTVCPGSNVAEHAAPQATPAGELVTEPEPLPARVTVTRLAWSKTAVVRTQLDTQAVQVGAVPEQPSPSQCPKRYPAPGVAVSM